MMVLRCPPCLDELSTRIAGDGSNHVTNAYLSSASMEKRVEENRKCFQVVKKLEQPQFTITTNLDTSTQLYRKHGCLHFERDFRWICSVQEHLQKYPEEGGLLRCRRECRECERAVSTIAIDTIIFAELELPF